MSVESKRRGLQLRQLDQVEDYVMPFDLTVEGFTEGWWDNPVGRVGDGNYDWLSFLAQGHEVARAEVDVAATLDDDYVGPPILGEVIDITFVEVHEDHRGQGFGREAVDLIVRRHPGRVLIAFAEESDEFWSAIGWAHRPRLDKSDRHRHLFVLDGRST